MKRPLAWLAVLLLTATWITAAPLPALQDHKRIVFLGDSITFGGHYVAWIDAWLTAAHPDPDRVVINLGLPSETVSGLSEEGHAGGRFPRPDLHERLGRVLVALKPDLVVACYGVNCGIYQPANEGRFKAYREGILKLRRAVQEQGGKVIHLTPWPYDHARGRIKTVDYNEAVLGRYTKWLLERRAEGWHVIDLHGPMTAEIRKRQAADSKFTFQNDGVHPNREGHWFAAQQVLRALGDEKAAGATNAKEMMARFKGGGEILPLVEQRMNLLRNAWLSQTRHLRPGIGAGLPISEAKRKAADLATQMETLR